MSALTDRLALLDPAQRELLLRRLAAAAPSAPPAASTKPTIGSISRLASGSREP